MDDWVVLLPSRWKLRKTIKITNRILEQLIVEKHPDKTFIGKIQRGFDFLGYHFNPRAANSLEVANKTIVNHVTNLTRLYEQGAGLDRIGNYIRHWWRWLQAGLIINISIAEIPDYPVPGYDAPLLPFIESPFNSACMHAIPLFT